MKVQNNICRIIGMGKIGSGKSSVLNSLTKSKHFAIGSSIKVVTKEVKIFTGKFRGRFTSPTITFIDTPGFIDGNSKDNTTIARITMELKQIKVGINIFLFCFSAYEIRLDSTMQGC